MVAKFTLQHTFTALAMVLLLLTCARESTGREPAGKPAQGGYYTLRFPVHGKLAELGIIDDGADYTAKHTVAKMFSSASGDVRVPRGAHLYFQATDRMGLGNPIALIDCIPVEALTSLTLSNNIFREDELAKVQRFGELRRLDLSGTEVSDDSLRKLVCLHQLQTLAVDRTRVRGRFLVDFSSNTSLRHLNLGHNDIERKYLQELKNFSNLQWLNLGTIGMRDIDLQTVASCSELKVLDLTENAALSDKGLLSLRQLKKLEVLVVPFTKITARGLLTLKGTDLKKVRIARQQGTEKDFADLKKAFPKLEVVFENLKEESFSIYKEVFE